MRSISLWPTWRSSRFSLTLIAPLRGAECLGGAREALEIGDGHESLDGIDIECGHISHPELLSLKYLVIQFTNAQAVTSLGL
ncbi:hypothetical protein ACVW1C_000679 [Bradyrhizobium sp. USDA 4011]